MSNQKRRAVLARCIAAASAILVLAAFSFDTASAGSRVKFQQKKILECDGSMLCYAFFPALPPNQALDVDHVWCKILLESGTVNDAEIYAIPNDPDFSIPLELGWLRSRAGSYWYTFRAEPGMRVAHGKRLVAKISHYGSGIISGSCSFTGFKIKI